LIILYYILWEIGEKTAASGEAIFLSGALSEVYWAYLDPNSQIIAET
jgi:hypothetical protein